jgi:hypothetical protein
MGEPAMGEPAMGEPAMGEPAMRESAIGVPTMRASAIRARRPCAVCGQAAAPYRRCTSEYICGECRCLSEHRVVTEAAALRALAETWNCHMTRAELRESLEPLSRIPNRVDRRWPMELLYRYSSLELVAGAAMPSPPPS